ncbi:MAG: DEAD/DEAH box helicase [Ruminococcus flavefaciens]|nr:DEAD/DEAH box helicase [Ruminococcus flavefaciens]MCM1361346.1 DEAD/DEAH box helicase [Clostridiales bacterium]
MDSVRKQTEDFFRNTAENGLEIRQGQVEMADEVCTAFEKRLPLAVEAEVGIGKSFAYLVPAILKFVQDHKQIVIATSTISLQEQLKRDAHNVLKMLGVNIDIVVAKGMKNYICKRRLKGFVSRNKQDFTAKKLLDIVRNGSQDIAKINMKIPDRILEKITIINFGNEYCNICESTMSCEYSAIRKQIAKGQNIVICNQNMLVSHLVNSERGRGIFAENCSAYIVDEAHNLESKFRDAFSVSYSRKDLINRINGCLKKVSSEKLKLANRLTGSLCETIQTLYVEFNRQVHQQQKGIDEGANSFFFTRTNEVLINAKELHRKIERFETFTEAYVPDVKQFVEGIIFPDSDNAMWIENGKNIRLCVCKKRYQQRYFKAAFRKKQCNSDIGDDLV